MKRLHRYPIGPSEGHGSRPDSRWSPRDFIRAGALATGGFAITLRGWLRHRGLAEDAENRRKRSQARFACDFTGG